MAEKKESEEMVVGFKAREGGDLEKRQNKLG